MKSGSNLEKVLAAGHFAVTAELGPPKGTDVEVIKKKAKHLAGAVDAVNITDNQTAIVRMSSIAAAALAIPHGLEPVMQMVCRDRNRIAMQSDLFGAVAHGIRNCLFITGDHPKSGNHPESKIVYDLDSIQAVAMARKLRDEKKALCGEDIEGEMPLYIGAAWTPLGDPLEIRPLRLAKKVDAGADFIQTQAIYDVKAFAKQMKAAGDLGLLDKVKMLVGVIPLKSVGMARYLQKNVPGVTVPEPLVKRLKDAGKEGAADEGIKIIVELIQQLREVPGVAGVHIMAIEWEHKVRGIVEAAGLLPRPNPQ
jgi:methylenetetrahydrofolate reductase (NADPH)